MMSARAFAVAAVATTTVFVVLAALVTPVAAQEGGLPAEVGDADGACFLKSGRVELVKNRPLRLVPPDPGETAKYTCEERLGGEFMPIADYRRLVSGSGSLLLPVDAVDGPPAGLSQSIGRLPADWYNESARCAWLGSTRPNQNALIDVYQAKGVELGVEIAYNIGSNEVTGITGAVLGAILGAAQSRTFAIEWKYELQAECQAIEESRATFDIQTKVVAMQSGVDRLETAVGGVGNNVTTILSSTNDILSNVTARLDASVSSRASQTSLESETAEIDSALSSIASTLTVRTDQIDQALLALDNRLGVETDEIDLAIANLGNDLQTETTEIDLAIANLGNDLQTETTEIDLAIAGLGNDLQTETTEIDLAIAGLVLSTATAGDQNIDFFIEDHLDTCSPLKSLLLDGDDGLLDETFVLVNRLIADYDRVASTGQARNHFRRAEQDVAAGKREGAFRRLCQAYRALR